MKKIIITPFIILFTIFFSYYDVIGEQSCCNYTMSSGITNYFNCTTHDNGDHGNCVWWAVCKRNDLNFMVHSPDSPEYPDYWVNTAKAKGYTVGTTPKEGAIAVYPSGNTWGYYGHVAYVESVSGNQYTVTEMGYNAWNCVRTKTRTTGQYDEEYIYPKGSSADLILTSPDNGAEFYKGTDINFNWQTVSGAYYYEIWIDNNSGFGSPEVGFDNGQSLYWIDDGIVSSAQFSLTVSMQNHLEQNVYYWKARALNSSKDAISDWSDVRSLTLLNQIYPPVLTSPNDNTEFYKGTDITFNWQKVSGASYYEIWIDNNSGFGSPEIGFDNGQNLQWVTDGIVSLNQFALTASMQSKIEQNLYYWKVRALNSAKNSITEWSEVRDFTLLNKNQSQILYVSNSDTYKKIQDAINDASDGYTILVKPGTYYENIDYKGKKITVKSVEGAEKTIINGNHAGTVVTFSNGETSESKLEGFTITNGYAPRGGGIYCYNSSPNLYNLTVKGNSAGNGDWVGGGGIICDNNSSPNLENITISNNSADKGSKGVIGGGLYCEYNSSPTLKSVTISDNSVSAVEPSIASGGGVFCGGSSNPKFENVLIVKNKAKDYTGGIGCYKSNPVLINATIAENSAGINAGGINCDDSAPTVVNSILWNNQPNEIGNDSVYPLTISYSDIKGGWNEGIGNINTDPLFVNPTNGNYHLSSGSPCIDNGSSTDAPKYDIEGNTRPQSSGYDIGAYEYTGTTQTKGYLQVSITPQEAVTAGAQWCLSNSCYNSGEKAELSPGTYSLEFKNITGWTRPANQPVVINAEQTKTVTESYTKIPSGSNAVLTLNNPEGSPGTKDISAVISLDNINVVTPVAAIELRIKYNAIIGIHANGKYTLSSRMTGFTGSVTVAENGENSEVRILLYNASGGTISAGTGAVLNILFDVDSTATIGKTSNFSFTECLVSDSAGKPIDSDCTGVGVFTIGSSCEPLGDINKDSKYNIFDLQMLINCILAKGSCDCCDLNADAKYNIFDIQSLINKILKLSARNREIRSAVNTLTFPDIELKADETGSFGLDLTNQGAVSAMQIDFTYDSTLGFEIAEAKITTRSEGFTVSMTPDKTDPNNVKMVILLYNMTGGAISAGTGNILEFTYKTATGSGTIPFTFKEALLSDKDAKSLSVTSQNGKAEWGGAVMACDPDGDGKLDLADVVYILQILTGIRK